MLTEQQRETLIKLHDDVISWVNVLINFDQWVRMPGNEGTEQSEIELELEESIKTIKQTLKEWYYPVDMNWDLHELLSKVNAILAGNIGPSPVLEREAEEKKKETKNA